MKTAQQVFDTTLTQLRMQGHAAFENGGCVYLASNGDRCAVGWHIPPELHSSAFENATVQSMQNDRAHWDDEGLLARNRALRDVLDELDLLPHAELLADMQAAHDQALDVNDSPVARRRWERRMADIARTHNLIYTEVA